VTKPSTTSLAVVLEVLEPWRKLTQPTFIGLERIPAERPLLFVGNHTLFGLLDVPLMIGELWKQKGIYLRGLGDHVHFKVPVWGELLRRFGAVDGTRENCAALMRAGETVLVFPGGAREVAKRKNEHYQLIWKDRLGFARMALRHGCTIVPFAAVGADDAYDIIVDGNEIMQSPIGTLVKKLGIKRDDFILPIARGFAGTPLPKPQRFYFEFAEPIPTSGYPGDDDTSARTVRDATRAAIESTIARLLELRDRDPRGRSPRSPARPRLPLF